MEIFQEIPFGYRWALEEDMERDDAVLVRLHISSNGVIYTQDEADLAVPWDCMVEFGTGHDHDPEECEKKILDLPMSRR